MLPEKDQHAARLSQETGADFDPNSHQADPVSPDLVDTVSEEDALTTLEIQRIDSAREIESAGFREHQITKPLSPPTKSPQLTDEDKVGAVASDTSNRRNTRGPRQPDPVLQSLMLLVTMAFMLVAARFAVPSIVEEIRYAWYRGELRAEYESGNEGLKNVSLDALSDAYQMVTSAVGPSVVHIEVERRSAAPDTQVARFLSSPRMPSADQGSGVVIDKDGFILTNSHVISDGEDISVTLSDGRRVPATIVGTDELTDLAVLKVEADGLMPIQWGDSDRCRVGSPVWAVGSPFGFDRSVTFGILSGKHRMVRAGSLHQDFMQSDVAVNPGNSGGPLVDAHGQLIGINTAIVGDTYQGVSFSIPSSVAKKVYEQLRERGEVERGWLGVSLANVTDEEFVGENHRVRGAMVARLASPNSPAALAGMKAGDVIVDVEGTRIRDVGHLMRVIGNALAGSRVEITVRRQGKEVDLTVRLDRRPEEPALVPQD